MYAIRSYYGYTKKTGFLAGLTVAQISEFSLIIASLGLRNGHLSQEIVSMITIIGIMTIAGSSYFITYSERIYSLLSNYLSIFEKKTKISENDFKNKNTGEIILFGADRTGKNILNVIENSKERFLIIDYNPKIIKDLSKKEYNSIYGDASNLELLNELNFKESKIRITSYNVCYTKLLRIIY